MSDRSAGVAARVAEVSDRIAAAARRAGRSATEVTLVAATKTVDIERAQAVVDAGVVDLGENRAQELLSKTAVTDCRWHFLGQLQRNKVRQLAAWVTCWQGRVSRQRGDGLSRCRGVQQVH